MRKWYPTLNKDEKSLLGKNKIEDGNIVVCRQHQYRNFTIVKNFIEFRELINSTPDQDRCFYEIIFGNQPRKIYFDIDVKIKENIDYDDIIKNLKHSINALIGKTDTVIFVYTSHTKEKKSYHVVVQNYYLNDKDESKCFYEETMKHIKPKYKEFIDSAVYSSVQQFRSLGSRKFGKDNIKKLDENLSEGMIEIANEKMKKNIMFKCSLIGNIDSCIYLQGYAPIKEIKKIETGYASEDDWKAVMDMLEQYYPSTFKFEKTLFSDGNLLIILKRLRPYCCGICDRVHENENGFVVVMGVNRDICFDCRRRTEDKKMQKIGSLGCIEEVVNEAIETISEISFKDLKKLSKTFDVSYNI